MHLRLAIPVLVACVCFAGTVRADQLADIKQKGEIVIGVRMAEPNSFVDPKTGEIVGYEVDHFVRPSAVLGVIHGDYCRCAGVSLSSTNEPIREAKAQTMEIWSYVTSHHTHKIP